MSEAVVIEMDSPPEAQEKGQQQQEKQQQQQQQQPQHDDFVLPETSRFRLQWQDVRLVVDVVTGKPLRRVHTDKLILNGLSGEANPGELLAIMGPSGGLPAVSSSFSHSF